MIFVIASIRIHEGRMTEFIEMFKKNVPNVLEERGCIEYSLTIDTPTELPPQETDKNVATVIEKWESLESLQAHMSAPHMLAHRDRTKDMVDNVTLKILKKA